MEFKVTKSEANLLEVDFEKFDQGILNLIKSELWNESETQVAGFKVTHPQVGTAHFVLKTTGKKQAKTIWNDAVKRASEAAIRVGEDIAKL